MNLINESAVRSIVHRHGKKVGRDYLRWLDAEVEGAVVRHLNIIGTAKIIRREDVELALTMNDIVTRRMTRI